MPNYFCCDRISLLDAVSVDKSPFLENKIIKKNVSKQKSTLHRVKKIWRTCTRVDFYVRVYIMSKKKKKGLTLTLLSQCPPYHLASLKGSTSFCGMKSGPSCYVIN